MQHGEGNSRHSKATSATLKTITLATSRSTFATLQHGKVMAQHQLMLRATWSRIPQHSKKMSKITSATSRSNFTTLRHRDLLLQQPRETLATFL
jgi:hypothetical protein